MTKQIEGTVLKVAMELATAELILKIQDHIGYENPVSVEVVGKQPIRWGLRYTIEVKVDGGVGV